MTEPFEKDPAAALNAVRRARQATAGRVAHGSLTYDLIYSTLAGGLVASLALPRPYTAAGTALCAMGLIVLMRTWANRNGVWVSGLTPKRARWVSLGLGAVLVVLAVSAFRLQTEGRWGLILGLAAVASVAAFIASRLWIRVYRAEIGAGA